MTSERKVNLPDQVMTPMEAPRAYPDGCLYRACGDHQGVIRTRQTGGSIVWAQDPTALGFQQMINTKIDLTMVDGQTVYQRA